MDHSQAVTAIFTSTFEAALSGSATLSDGRQEFAWASVPRALAALATFFDEQGLAPRDPVALECASSVPGALTLLALLSRGATVVLLPHPGIAIPNAPLPSFVTRRLRVRHPSVEGQAISAWHPETFVEAHPVVCSHPLPADSPLRKQHLILRTSGSLAEPKWVVHTHAGLLANARNAIERLGLEATDRVLIPVPLGHMYGLGAGFLPALTVGARIELLEAANLVRYLERERAFHPTVAFLTPNLCSMLLRPRSAPTHYRHIVVAGDKLSAPSFHQAAAIYRRVVNLYGSTEMGVICATDARQPLASDAVTVGQPLPGVRLRVERRAGDDAGAGPGDGEDAGELLCAHPHGFIGYLDLEGHPVPVESAAGPAWYATHDLARLQEHGALEVLGRSDHATKRDGRLVMLAEVERALARLPSIAGAAIVLGGLTMRGRAMIAFVTAQNGAEIDLGRLRHAAMEALPSYAVPDELRLIPALPLLPSGKLDRRALEHTFLLLPAPEASRDHGPNPT
jgi:acyl-coenzyme A synthetase/AMP-(fatty) acid ligase